MHTTDVSTESATEGPQILVPREVPVEFHGTGPEFFRIWIVNTLLSILTLGIYSAWAKVRSRRYFYGNTRIDGSHFEYLAEPTQILKGRLLVSAVFGSIFIGGVFFPPVFSALPVAIGLMTPWIVVKAARFNARMSSFRNVRFNFTGTMHDSYSVFLFLPITVGLTLGAMLPYVHARQSSFMFSGHDYGRLPFHDEIPTRKVYLAYGLAGVFVVLAIVALVLLVGVPDLSALAEDADPAPDEAVGAMAQLLAMYALGALAFLFLNTIVSTFTTNGLMNTGGLTQRCRFRSTLSTPKLLGIRLGYGLLTILTLGVAYPWMRVRLARYRASCTTVILTGSFDDIADDARTSASAVSDQLGEALDVDFDLGF